MTHNSGPVSPNMDFCNAHIYSRDTKLWRPWTHKYYPQKFKDQVMQLLIGQRQPTSSLYVLPKDILFHIFTFMSSGMAPAHNYRLYNYKEKPDYRIQEHLKSKIVQKEFDENGMVSIDHDATINYYLGKMYAIIPLATSATYENVYSIIKNVRLTNAEYPEYPFYHTDGQGLFIRDYLYNDICINAPTTEHARIPLNILCNSSHQQPFPLYKTRRSKFEIKLELDDTLADTSRPIVFEYELLDLEVTQRDAQSPILQKYLDKMINKKVIMYEQMQAQYNIFQIGNQGDSEPLLFNHCMKTMIWMPFEQPPNIGDENIKWTFRLNGHNRLEPLLGVYFNKLHPYKYYDKFMPKNVYLYSFVSNPTNYKGQHGLNASRIDDFRMITDTTPSNNYNCYGIVQNNIILDDDRCYIRFSY